MKQQLITTVILLLSVSLLNNFLIEVAGQGAVELPPIEIEEEPPVVTNPPVVVVDYSGPLALAQANIAALQQQLALLNQTLHARIVNLEVNYYNVLSDKVTAMDMDLNAKISKVAMDLNTNVNQLTTYLDTNLAQVASTANANLNSMNAELQFQITNASLTMQSMVNGLEFGKVQLLLNYNTLWRKNFKRVNNTLINLRKKANGQGNSNTNVNGRRLVVG